MTNPQVSEATKYYHKVITALHRFDDPDPAKHWIPHESQALVGNAIFQRNCKLVFVQCGRKFGKTEIVIYSLWRHALLNPNSACYYICPELKQAREIVWKSKDIRGGERIQTFGPSEFISSIDNTDLRITFKNGSFIKVDGSDNFDAWAGITPNFIVLDEFRSFKPEFYGVMNPNRAVFDAPMIIIGTPPKKIWIDKDTQHQYVQLAKEAREDMLAGGDSFWIQRPSWSNPNPVIQKFLAKEKKVLFKRGQEDEWYREYGAELVPEKARKIFPNFIADETLLGAHVISHDLLIERLAGF